AQAQDEYNETELEKNYPSSNTNIRLLEVVIANDSNNNKISPKVAQEIVENKDILGVIGHQDSSVTKAALEVYKKQGLAMVTTSTSTELKGEFFFRTNINNSKLSEKLADYLQKLDIEKAMVFYNEQNSFSRNIKEHFDTYFTSLKPGNQVELEDLNKEYFNTKKAVQNAVDKKFQAAILFQDTKTINQAIEIAKDNNQFSEQQRLKLFSPGTLYECDTLNEGNKAVKGLILAVPWFKGLPTAKPFLDRAVAQWGGPVEWRAATSYDAAKAFISALSNSGDNPTRAKVLEELKEVNVPPEETSSGQNLRFNPDGEIAGQPILVEVVESRNPACSNLDFRLVEE
ncbi:MAG: ABC transporter substrate-binding protein, partial [Okeania sp. SIO2D1]|nr:ABC transporter substrate-binding protein [Okeania sp. SIO2D1]